MKFNGETMTAFFGVAAAGAGIDDEGGITENNVWSSKHTVDMLCPPIDETGAVVSCEPISDYLLEVISEVPYTEGQPLSSITLTRLGANLIPYPYYDSSKTMNGIDFTINDDGSVTMKGTATIATSFRLVGNGAGVNAAALPDWIVPSMTYTLSTKDNLPTGARIIAYFYDEANVNLGYIQAANTSTGKVFDGAVRWWVFISINKDVTVDHTIYPMLQLGSVSTEYELFSKLTYTADFSDYGETDTEGSYNWTAGVLVDNIAETEVQRKPQPMPAFDGVNTFVSRCNIGGDIVISNTTVKGRKDPVALINKLEATVNALLEG